MPSRPAFQPLHHPLASGSAEQPTAQAIAFPPPPSPPQQGAFKAARFEEVEAPQQHADTASSSAAKPVPRETQPLPLPGLPTKYICNICGRVAYNSSMPDGGLCCNQPVEEYSEAPQQHADTPSSSAAEPAPAPVGNLHQCDVNWLLDPRLVDARLRWHAGLLNSAGISSHIAELEAIWGKFSWLSQEDFAGADDGINSGTPRFCGCIR